MLSIKPSDNTFQYSP